jgi:hypothetical protein
MDCYKLMKYISASNSFKALSCAIWIGLVASLGCEPFAFDQSHQSDQALMHNFDENAAKFVELVKMSNEDEGVIRIAHDFTRLRDTWNWPRPEQELGYIFNEVGSLP